MIKRPRTIRVVQHTDADADKHIISFPTRRLTSLAAHYCAVVSSSNKPDPNHYDAGQPSLSSNANAFLSQDKIPVILMRVRFSARLSQFEPLEIVLDAQQAQGVVRLFRLGQNVPLLALAADGAG